MKCNTVSNVRLPAGKTWIPKSPMSLAKTLIMLTILLGADLVLRAGTFQELYAFPSGVANPYPNGLTLAADGAFYGTTSTGGSAGLGSVFRLTPAGAMATCCR